MTREEHLAWAKERALDYVEAGDMSSAVASMISDLGKHEGTRLINIGVYADGAAAALSDDPELVRRWIDGITLPLHVVLDEAGLENLLRGQVVTLETIDHQQVRLILSDIGWTRIFMAVKAAYDGWCERRNG